MNRHQRLYAQVFRREMPRFLKRVLLVADPVKKLPRVKRKCDYCEAYGLKDKEGEPIWHSRATLRREPTGLFRCGNHKTAVEAQMEGFINAYERIEGKEYIPIDDGSV